MRQYNWATKLRRPSVWLTSELPELKARYLAGKITKLTVVRVSDLREFDQTGVAFRNEPEPDDRDEDDNGAEPPEPGSDNVPPEEPVDHRSEAEITKAAVELAKIDSGREGGGVQTKRCTGEGSFRSQQHAETRPLPQRC